MSNVVNYPLINGVYSSWASVEIRVANRVIGGITAINYAPSLEPADVLGAGAQPIGLTEGMAKYEGDFEILEIQWYALLDVLGQGYGRVPFTVNVSKAPVGDDDSFEPAQDTLLGCRITSVSGTYQASTADALVKKVKMKMLRINENGLNIYGVEVNPDI